MARDLNCPQFSFLSIHITYTIKCDQASFSAFCLADSRKPSELQLDIKEQSVRLSNRTV